MRLRSMFLVGCIALTLPGVVTSVFSAMQAWTAWWTAQVTAYETEATGAMMRAATVLMVERGYLHAAFSGTADPEALARVARISDAALAEAERALHRAGLPTTPVDQARDALSDSRRRAIDAAQRNLSIRAPTERLNRVVEGFQEETLRVERRIMFASPSVGMMVELARTANELRGIAGRRAMVLSTWFGRRQDLTPAQRDELLMLTGRLAGAWDRLQRGVRASSPSPSVTQAMAFTDEHFFGQEEPWYRELINAAVAGDDRPLSHAKYRDWSIGAIEHLLPVRDALVAEGMAQSQAAIGRARRALLIGCAITAVSLVLAIAAVLVLLRSIVQPVRRMTENMAALAGGDLEVATSAQSRLREISAMADAVEVFRDNTISLRQRELELQRINLQFAAALESMSQGLAMYDSAERLTVFNRRFCQITGISPEQVRLGMSYYDVLALGVGAGNFPGRSVQDVYAEGRSHVARLEAGSYHEQLAGDRAVAVRYEPMVGGGGWVSTFEDVTERRAAEARIVHMAHHDALTGLPNRFLLRERLEQVLSQARRGEPFAMLCLDLDDFKSINDTLGHPVGDALLCEVADRLRSSMRATDTIARLGGDEFAVVQVLLDQPENAAALAHRLADCLSAPYVIKGHQVTIGVSIGVALAPADGLTADELLKNADLALYRAKGDGRGVWRFFEREMDTRMQARRLLELDLRHAVAAEDFTLHYQPLVNLRTGRPTGFEALLRWPHAERGLVPPGEFIPVAEEMGLIVPISEWVLRRACQEAASRMGALKVAVNLSAVQFRPGNNLVRMVASALEAAGLPASRLELEITETALLQDTAETIATLHHLKRLGVSISMDDFGTGHSSLSYLLRFPFSKVKIDQSFVRGLGDRGDSAAAIVRAVVGLGASLNMTVIAEGVETEEQLDQLAAQGLNEVQGYLFSRPLPVDEIPRLLNGPSGPRRSRSRAGFAPKAVVAA